MEQRLVGKDHEGPRLEAGGQRIPGLGIVGRLRDGRGHEHHAAPSHAMLDHRGQAVAVGGHHGGRRSPAVGGRLGRFELPVAGHRIILPRHCISHPPEGGEDRVIERRRCQVVALAAPPHPHEVAAEHPPRGIGVEPLRTAGPRPQPDREAATTCDPALERLPDLGRERRRIEEHDPLGGIPRDGAQRVDVDHLGLKPRLSRLHQQPGSDRLRDEGGGSRGGAGGGHDHLGRRPHLDGEVADVVGLQIVGALDHHAALAGAGLQPRDVEIDLHRSRRGPLHGLHAPADILAVAAEHLHRHGAGRVGAGS